MLSRLPSISETSNSKADTTCATTLERVASSDLEEQSYNLEAVQITSPRSQQSSALSNGSLNSTSLNMAPKWVYGTTLPLPSSHASNSAGSGLCLAERGQLAIAQPEVIQNFLFPSSDVLKRKIINYRNNVVNLLSQDVSCDTFDKPLLIITGPTYVQNPNQIKACAQWVGTLIGKHFDNLPHHHLLPAEVSRLYHREEPRQSYRNLMFAIRTNLSKYNTDIDTPQSKLHSRMTYEIEQGIPICRALLCELAEICPIVGEASDTITPQYLSDLYCLGFVSSTLTESQLHRELVSGLSYSIGFSTSDSNQPFSKSSYKHRINAALDAMYASSQQHQFLSVTKIGTVAVVGTIGNEDTFIILQVNSELTANDLSDIISTVYAYQKLKFNTPRIMLDVGRITNDEFEFKLAIVTQLMTTSETMYKIVGVLIDSGDNYIPKGYQIDLAAAPDVFEESLIRDHVTTTGPSHEATDDYSKLVQLNKYFVRNRIFQNVSAENHHSSDTVSRGSDSLHGFYEYFVNAERFIGKLSDLSDARIGR